MLWWVGVDALVGWLLVVAAAVCSRGHGTHFKLALRLAACHGHVRLLRVIACTVGGLAALMGGR